jgi:beta-galactosidase
VVPGARNLIRFTVSGAGTLKATDNGRQENARGYTSPEQETFFGQALAVVGSGRSPGVITLTAAAEGLAPATLTLRSAPAPGGGAIPGIVTGPGAPAPAPGTPSAPTSAPLADASFSGQPNTLPAAMLDGNPSTYWSNYYVAAKTANVLAVSVSDASDWVSLTWPSPQRISGLTANFVTGGARTLPASATVSYWDGHSWIPARNVQVTWATASGDPTTITFDPVTAQVVRLTMTSPASGTGGGFLAISSLTAAT